MAKGGSAKMLYFVLYIVLITELLIVITERDELQESEKHIQQGLIGGLAEAYKLPIKLNVAPMQSSYDLGSKIEHEVIFELSGLVSDAEKSGVVYTVKLAPGSKGLSGFPAEGLHSDKEGDGKFSVVKTNGTAKFSSYFESEGEYKFEVFASTSRKLPEYLPEKSALRDSLIAKIGKNPEADKVTSNTVVFTISAKKQGGVKKAGAQIVG